eukprot:gene9770-7650_t
MISIGRGAPRFPGGPGTAWGNVGPRGGLPLLGSPVGAVHLGAPPESISNGGNAGRPSRPTCGNIPEDRRRMGEAGVNTQKQSLPVEGPAEKDAKVHSPANAGEKQVRKDARLDLGKGNLERGGKVVTPAGKLTGDWKSWTVTHCQLVKLYRLSVMAVAGGSWTCGPTAAGKLVQRWKQAIFRGRSGGQIFRGSLQHPRL